MVEHGGGSITVIGSEAAHSDPRTGGCRRREVRRRRGDAQLALELGPVGIRVNIVSPGMVLTELSEFIPEAERSELAQVTPLRRNATPDDVAGAVLMMASGHAGYVTGAHVPVQGGIRIG